MAETLVKSGWTFAQVPIVVYQDRKLSDGAKVLFSYLAWRQGQHDCAWPSVTTMAEDLGISDRAVQRRITELEARGWLTVVRRTGHSSQYTIYATRQGGDAAVTPDTNDTTDGDATVTPSGDASVTHNDRRENDKRLNAASAAPTLPLAESSDDSDVAKVETKKKTQQGEKRSRPRASRSVKRKDESPVLDYVAYRRQEFYDAVRDVCPSMDDRLKRDKAAIGAAAREIDETGVCTVEEIREWFKPGGLWEQNDWRGKKGQPLTPAVLVSCIGAMRLLASQMRSTGTDIGAGVVNLGG
jgi:hypothetical protein